MINRIVQRFAAALRTLLTSKEDRLRAAARDGDMDQLRALLRAGARIDAVPASKFPSTSHGSALHVAVYNGRHEAVRALLEHGAKANLINFHRATPLSLWYRQMLRAMEAQGLTPQALPRSDIEVGIALMEFGGRAVQYRNRSGKKPPSAMLAPTEDNDELIAELARIVRANVEHRALAREAPKAMGRSRPGRL